MEYQQKTHPFPPVCDDACRLLVLGSFPSVKSIENEFYYGHPQNRFWQVLAAVFAEKAPLTLAEKRAILLRHHIALWDVVASCDVIGSSDSSIRAAVPNDLGIVLRSCPIERILFNGKTAEKLYLRFWKTLDMPHQALPSTSPANAAWTLDRLCEAWGQALRA